jgi:hypothetical protein
VSRIVWLASYPKSGNTWFRLLVANLGADMPVDINEIGGDAGGGIASGRAPFDHHTLLDSGLLTHDEADALRPQVYELMRPDNDQIRLIKAHDAWVATATGEPLLGGARVASGAIVIVRDPRAIACSLANHRRSTIDEAIDFMARRTAVFAGGVRGQNRQLRQRMLDWSGHVASWLDQTDIPAHLVRYEDMRASPPPTFTAAMAFAGWEVAPSEVGRAVEFTQFDRLQAQERANGFTEWRPAGTSALFFRRGEAEGWRRELTPEQVQRIESVHGPMMQRLGYELSKGEGAPCAS